MRKYSFCSVEQTLSELDVSADRGLTSRRAAERLAFYGRNALNKDKSQGLLKLFFSQFKYFMTLLLIVAAAVSAVVAFLSGDTGDLTDTVIITAIIFLNAAVGCIQQYRADKALESLKKLSVCKVKVRRDGRDGIADSDELTVGDVIMLEEGDVVPADCRIISSSGLYADESALTGESTAAEKNADTLSDENCPLGSTTNALFSSTYVVRGNATAVVTGVGMNTEMGAIADLLGEADSGATPLEKSLGILGKAISAFVLAVSATIFLVGMFARGQDALSTFMTSVAIAVAAIPEGLPAVVTIIMAMGVQKMSRKNVVIRKLKSVETLGGCNVICTDKTGTLTCNKMKVVKTVTRDETALVRCMAVCCDVKGERGAYIGDTTEIALLNYADLQGFDEEWRRVDELPFSSDRKMMSVRAECGGRTLSFTKGAPDILLKKCDKILTPQGVRPISSADISGAIAENEAMSRDALRVLGFAFRPDGRLEEEGLAFIGLCAMSDRLKPGVRDAVAECRRAGIRTVMITGDHALTAFAIARELGIAEDMSQVVTGEKLDAMTKKQRAEAISGGRVFARVTPGHKNIIVKILRQQGNVVAMTGDGINDAPSIKSADIGIAMGVTGTDVTKNASDMVITDDNFATIVSAVREGRRISANVKKTIQFFLSTNLAEVLAILTDTLFFAKNDFLTTTQLLWINLITDSFPVLALGMEREDFGVMNRPPERAERALFSKSSVAGIMFFGLYITVVTVVLYACALSVWGNAVATTVTFVTVSFSELFHAFNVRSESRSAFRRFFSNRTLLVTVAAGIAVNVILCMTPAGAVFGAVALNAKQWAAVLGCSLSVIAAGEVYKFVMRRVHRIKKRSTAPRVVTRTAGAKSAVKNHLKAEENLK